MTIPTLHDERVEAMRDNVMHRVERDVQRRGKRARVAVGLTAASVLVVGFGGYTLSAVYDEGSTSEMSRVQPSSVRDESAGSGAAENLDGLGDKTAVPERQVITTGEVRATVERPQEVAQRLASWVESIGGRIDNRSESGSGEGASASLTVRVPSDRVTATIERIKTYGDVDDVSVRNSDVTAAAQDLDARIGALELSISRLEKIMADTASSAELIKAEGALTQRQEQLESLQAQRKGLADQVSLSTLAIELAQEGRVDSVEPGGFGGGLRDGWNALVSTVNAVVELAGRVLPWAAIVVVLLGAVRLFRRRRSWN